MFYITYYLPFVADPCRGISSQVDFLAHHCINWYATKHEETRSFGPGWETEINANSTSVGTLYSVEEAFMYTSQKELNGSTFWGKLAIDTGGGYIANLGNHKHEAISLVEELEQTNWIDQYTRAVFIEFTVWNANTNLFNLFKLSVEFPPIGGMFLWKNIDAVELYRYSGAGGVINLMAEILLIIYVVIFTIVAMRDMVKQKGAYWSNLWNVMFVVTLALFYVAFGCYVARSLWTIKTVELMMNNPGIHFICADLLHLNHKPFTYLISAKVFSQLKT